MNSKNILLCVVFVILSLLSLLWFLYEAGSYLSYGVPRDENPAFSWFLAVLKLLMAISFFYSAIKYLRKRD